MTKPAPQVPDPHIPDPHIPDPRRQLKHRLMLVWMLLCAFWLAGVSIWIADTRPAPGFVAVSSLLIGGAMVFAAALMAFYLRRRG